MDTDVSVLALTWISQQTKRRDRRFLTRPAVNASQVDIIDIEITSGLVVGG